MNKNIRIYAWLQEVFGSNSFPVDEFRAVFPSSQATKTLFDLAKLGFLIRIKKRVYKTIEPAEFIRKIVEENSKAEYALQKSDKKYAYCCNDAVIIWTEGYSWTGFTKGYKPIHIKVLKHDVKYWAAFFKKAGVEFVFENEVKSKTLFGIVYILHPVEKMSIEIKNTLPVVPLKETVRFCRENELAYFPALEYLNEKYKLNLMVKKEEEYV